MKRILMTCVVLALAATAFAQVLTVTSPAMFVAARNAAVFHWTTTNFDFGSIPVGKPVTHEFRFTNNGTAPLVISSVQASCGCTVTEYSKDPIEPGAEGFVKATYNAAKVGVFTKTVSVNANTEEGIVQLIIKGEVVQ